MEITNGLIVVVVTVIVSTLTVIKYRLRWRDIVKANFPASLMIHQVNAIEIHLKLRIDRH